MNKLKTLKDLNWALDENTHWVDISTDKSKMVMKPQSEVVNIQDLKNEAIKWIEALERGFKSNSNVNSEGNPFLALAFELPNDGLIDWIKGFFNIEEKNLK